MKLPWQPMVSPIPIPSRSKSMNSKWNLKQTPGDAEGVQLGFAESLQEHNVRLQQIGGIKEGKLLRSNLVVMEQISERGLQLSISLLLF